jgi:hypothetical protein
MAAGGAALIAVGLWIAVNIGVALIFTGLILAALGAASSWAHVQHQRRLQREEAERAR